MTKTNKIIGILMQFFLIALVIELVIIYYDTSHWNNSNYIAFAIIIIAILYPVRIFFATLMYFVHFYGMARPTTR